MFKSPINYCCAAFVEIRVTVARLEGIVQSVQVGTKKL